MSKVSGDAPRVGEPGGRDERFHLRARTYYDDPSHPGPDEHRITFGTWIKNEYFSAFYEGEDWEVEWVSCYDRSGVAGGMVVVTVILNNCKRPGMENAVLSLTTDLNFAIDFPRYGSRTVYWTAKLTGTDVQVIDVMN